MVTLFRTRTRSRLKKVAAAGVMALVVLVVHRFALPSLVRPPGHTDTQGERQLAGLGSALDGNAWADDVRDRTDVKVQSADVSNQTGLKVKTILMYTFPYYYELKSGPGAFSSCAFPCTLTLDEGLVEDVDSVVFYSHNFASRLPQQRAAHQVWVFFAVESPANSRNSLLQKPQWRGLFNWTMTYRRDSDFYFGYGDFVRAPLPTPRKDLPSVVSGKTKLVAWFVSNCHTPSKREEVAEALKGLVEVDVFGQCGTLSCGSQDDMACMAMLSRDYFFYLSFENSLCTDYITEKVYHIMKLADVVPVVRGGANYTSLLPAHSFIDVSQFGTVRALADHLKKVAGDRQLYESYLAWKRDWQVIEPVPFSFCQFCQRLHHQDRWARTYPDINSWWVEGRCREPPAVVTS